MTEQITARWLCSTCRHGEPLIARSRWVDGDDYRHCARQPGPHNLPQAAWMGVRCGFHPHKWEGK